MAHLLCEICLVGDVVCIVLSGAKHFGNGRCFIRSPSTDDLINVAPGALLGQRLQCVGIFVAFELQRSRASPCGVWDRETATIIVSDRTSGTETAHTVLS